MSKLQEQLLAESHNRYKQVLKDLASQKPLGKKEKAYLIYDLLDNLYDVPKIRKEIDNTIAQAVVKNISNKFKLSNHDTDYIADVFRNKILETIKDFYTFEAKVFSANDLTDKANLNAIKRIRSMITSSTAINRYFDGSIVSLRRELENLEELAGRIEKEVREDIKESWEGFYKIPAKGKPPILEELYKSYAEIVKVIKKNNLKNNLKKSQMDIIKKLVDTHNKVFPFYKIKDKPLENKIRKYL